MSALRTLLQLGGNETALTLRTIYVYHTSMDTTRNSNPGCLRTRPDVKWSLKHGVQAETAEEAVVVWQVEDLALWKKNCRNYTQSVFILCGIRRLSQWVVLLW